MGIRVSLPETVVIATGSRPTRADSFDALGDRVIVSDDVFDWQDLPKSVAVIGPGIIGLELGQALHRLGVRVAILGRGGRVGPISDPEILAYAIAAFKQEFTLEPDAHIADMRRDGDRVAIHRTAPDGAEQVETFDYVLVATGRTPNVQGIGLEKTSVKLDAKGVPEYDPATAQTVSTEAGARAARSSSPATRATSSRCCTRRPTKDALRGTMPRVSRLASR